MLLIYLFLNRMVLKNHMLLHREHKEGKPTLIVISREEKG